MSGGDTTASEEASAESVLSLIGDVGRLSSAGFSGCYKKDCADLARKISLLAHLFEEMMDREGTTVDRVDVGCYVSDLIVALQAAKKLLVAANNHEGLAISSDNATKKLLFGFQCVTWRLEKALASLPYEEFETSEEVREQVELVRTQLRRATEKYDFSPNSSFLHRALSQPLDKEIDPFQAINKSLGSLHIENIGNVDHEVSPKAAHRASNEFGLNEIISENSTEISACKDSDTSCKTTEENKKPDSPLIPVDFLCPISLELMRDPVIVATGQTYERSYIQRWIDCGNTTCPKTQQKLQHLTLTPNYILRSLISQWCSKHNVEQPTSLINGKIKKRDGSFCDVTEDIAAIESLVHKLSSRSVEERRAAVTEIRSLSKRSTDNRILLAEAGAIPILVSLLASEDRHIQDNAVTSVLNMSIYENNKGLIMLANAVPSIVQVLRCGSMEAKENSAATLFSLSLADENKIIIGASGAIPALVDLLRNGSSRGKKDAATALFNLCIYQGNKGRAVRAGIIPALLQMLTESNSTMIDEVLTILSVLASHHEAKVAIVSANTIPVLIDLLRTGLPRNKENSCAILVSLCKRDLENLACLSRLGAVIPLSELARNGTDRAKRKANSLLEHLRKVQLV